LIHLSHSLVLGSSRSSAFLELTVTRQITDKPFSQPDFRRQTMCHFGVSLRAVLGAERPESRKRFGHPVTPAHAPPRCTSRRSFPKDEESQLGILLRYLPKFFLVHVYT
jgi:hypothetical protein